MMNQSTRRASLHQRIPTPTNPKDDLLVNLTLKNEDRLKNLTNTAQISFQNSVQ